MLDTEGQLNVVLVFEGNGGVRARTVMLESSAAANDAIIATAAAGKVRVTTQALETFCAQQRHAARQRGESVRVYLRVADVGGRVYVDLGPGRVVCISASGVEMMGDADDGVPLFRRGAGAGQLPDPQPVEKPSDALRFAVGVFTREFGFTRDQALVTVAAILEYFRTETPHPILELVGPGGSGKSTAADYIRSLIDPPDSGGRMTVGTSAPDIAAAAQQQYVLSIDNAGPLDRATSNLLCIVSTGGTLSVRLLYTNSETAALKLHRPLIVTAVSPVCVAPDLQTRVERIDLPARSTGYQSDEEITARLNALRPRMLGALYYLLSHALRAMPAIRAKTGWTHRLVDFEQMGEAMLAGAGLKADEFSATVARTRESMARRTASGDRFLLELLQALRKASDRPTHQNQLSLNAVLQCNPAISTIVYEGTKVEVTARPNALRALMPMPTQHYGRDSAIPATDRALGDALRRVQPLLDGIGITLQELRSGTRSLIRFNFDRSAVDEL